MQQELTRNGKRSLTVHNHGKETCSIIIPPQVGPINALKNKLFPMTSTNTEMKLDLDLPNVKSRSKNSRNNSMSCEVIGKTVSSKIRLAVWDIFIPKCFTSFDCHEVQELQRRDWKRVHAKVILVSCNEFVWRRMGCGCNLVIKDFLSLYVREHVRQR